MGSLQEDDTPDHFRCPISNVCFVNPVIANDGHTYERTCIERWFKANSTSPMTREVLENKALTPNLLLKSQIADWRDGRQNTRDKDIRQRLFQIGYIQDGRSVLNSIQALSSLVTDDPSIVIALHSVQRLREILSGKRDISRALQKDIQGALAKLEARSQAQVDERRSELNETNLLKRMAEKKSLSTDRCVEEMERWIEDMRKRLTEAQGEARRDKKVVQHFDSERRASSKRLRKAEKGSLGAPESDTETETEAEADEGSTSKSRKKKKTRVANKDRPPTTQMGLLQRAHSLFETNPETAKVYLMAAITRGDECAEAYGLLHGIKMDEQIEEEEEEGDAHLYKKAFKHFVAAADNGHLLARYQVGVCYECGIGVDENMKTAIQNYKYTATDTGGFAQSLAQASLGRCSDLNTFEAFKWYRSAAEGGHAPSQIYYGDCHMTGRLYNETGEQLHDLFDKVGALEWYRKAAKQKSVKAIFNCGMCYQKGCGVIEDCEEALRWYRKAVATAAMPPGIDANDVMTIEGWSHPSDAFPTRLWADAAQYQIAYCHENGLGTTEDFTLAIEAYKKVTMPRHRGLARNGIGCCVMMQSVNVDRVETAMKWFIEAEEAAEDAHGASVAEFNLALCYDRHTVDHQAPLEVDDPQKAAFGLYTSALNQHGVQCKTIHWAAANNLGLCYLEGRGCPRNDEEGVKHLEMAANNGHVASQFNLALFHAVYSSASTEHERYMKAVEWYQKAADLGDIEAMNNLGICHELGHGVPRDIERAKQLYLKASNDATVDHIRDMYQENYRQAGTVGRSFQIHQTYAVVNFYCNEDITITVC